MSRCSVDRQRLSFVGLCGLLSRVQSDWTPRLDNYASCRAGLAVSPKIKCRRRPSAGRHLRGMHAIPDRAVHDERQLVSGDRTTFLPPGFEGLEHIPIILDLNNAADHRVIPIALYPLRRHEIKRQEWKVYSERH